HFAVALDEMRAHWNDNHLRLAPGARGELVVHNMHWAEGEASPQFHATLSIDVTGDALFNPEAVDGVRGAQVRVEGGRTHLILDARLSAEGVLETDIGLTLRGVDVRTTMASEGQGPAPRPVTLPVEPLAAEVPRVTMRAVEVPTPRPASPPVTAPTPQLPSLPGIQVRPRELIALIEDTRLSVSIPADRLSLR